MKRTMISISLILSAFISVIAQETASISEPVTTEIKWQNLTHNIGKIKMNQDLKVDFNYTNTGNTPLIISNVKTSCGCTLGKYSKAPLQPGETASITVSYDTRRIGKFSKTITVYSNTPDKLTKLNLSGEVLKE
jgi:hypothetical protein